jgi:hypothetical protein
MSKLTARCDNGWRTSLGRFLFRFFEEADMDYILTIETDIDAESPNDWDGWKLHSFWREHVSFTRREEFVDENDNLKIGIRRKLECGTAFWLIYYEHGLCLWKLYDAESVWKADGILVYDGKVTDLSPDKAVRKEYAKGFVDAYTEWSNGNCYYFSLKEYESGLDADSCGGFYGLDDLAEGLNDYLCDGDLIVAVEGDCKDMAQYLKLKKGVEICLAMEF